MWLYFQINLIYLMWLICLPGFTSELLRSHPFIENDPLMSHTMPTVYLYKYLNARTLPIQNQGQLGEKEFWSKNITSLDPQLNKLWNPCKVENLTAMLYPITWLPNNSNHLRKTNRKASFPWATEEPFNCLFIQSWNIRILVLARTYGTMQFS